MIGVRCCGLLEQLADLRVTVEGGQRQRLPETRGNVAGVASNDGGVVAGSFLELSEAAKRVGQVEVNRQPIRVGAESLAVQLDRLRVVAGARRERPQVEQRDGMGGFQPQSFLEFPPGVFGLPHAHERRAQVGVDGRFLRRDRHGGLELLERLGIELRVDEAHATILVDAPPHAAPFQLTEQRIVERRHPVAVRRDQLARALHLPQSAIGQPQGIVDGARIGGRREHALEHLDSAGVVAPGERHVAQAGQRRDAGCSSTSSDRRNKSAA